MATVSTRSVVDTIIERRGFYPGDEHLPPCIEIIEYDTKWDTVAWGLLYERDRPDKYRESDTVRNPRTIWKKEAACPTR